MKSKIAGFLREYGIFFLIVAVVVCAGIYVPGAIIRMRANRSVIEQGQLDIGQIQPYGADILELEQRFTNTYMLYYEIGDLDDTSNFRNVIMSDMLYNDRYASLPDGTGSAFYNIVNATSSTFGWMPPSAASVRRVIDDNGNSGFVVALGDRGGAILEETTGIPVSAQFSFVSESYGDLGTYWSNILSAYNDYSGIAFIAEDPNVYYTEEDYDVVYERSVISADGRFTLTLSVTGGWYWTPPEFEGDNWHATDSYVWNIWINLYEN